MLNKIAENLEDTKLLWESLLYNSIIKYNENPNFCNNIQVRGAYLTTAVLATVEVVACLAATIFSGLATLFTCCKNESLNKIAAIFAERTILNAFFVPISVLRLIHPNLGIKYRGEIL